MVEELIFELSEYRAGSGISPNGIESFFEERQVLVTERMRDCVETKSLVSITGYLNHTIEMEVKWNEELKQYKHHQKVIDLVKRGKVIIYENLKMMFPFEHWRELDDGLYEDIYSQLDITSNDRQENHIFISIKGVGEKELAEFGSLDVQVKAVKHLISHISGDDFHQKRGGYPTERKVIALFLNEIGELMRNLSLAHEVTKDCSNMDLVKHFMEHWQEDRKLVAIIEKDNEEIRKEEERNERRQRMINSKKDRR